MPGAQHANISELLDSGNQVIGPETAISRDKVLFWLTGIGLFGLAVGALVVAEHFADHFGPVLRMTALYVAFAVLACIVVGIYKFGRSDAVACWRALYLVPALLLGFGAYCNTGDVWTMDRATALAAPAEHLKDLYRSAAPDAREREWVARAYRDVAIAKAQGDYELTVARLPGARFTPLPKWATPWLWLLAAAFAAIAWMPRSKIEGVISRGLST